MKVALGGDRIVKRSGAGVENMADSFVGIMDVRVRGSESTRSSGECVGCTPGSFGDGRQKY
jgi:hypothetical protein